MHQNNICLFIYIGLTYKHLSNRLDRHVKKVVLPQEKTVQNSEIVFIIPILFQFSNRFYHKIQTNGS